MFNVDRFADRQWDSRFAKTIYFQFKFTYYVLFPIIYVILIEPVVAPFVDVTRMPGDYLTKIHKETGLSAVTLAFVLGGAAGCDPQWGGEGGIDNPQILESIHNFQRSGGKVILATGGAMGPYLETACSSPNALSDAYKKALNTVGSTHLDIDIG